MTRAILLAGILWSTLAIPAEATFKVFYCIYEDRACVFSDNPKTMKPDEVTRLADLALTGAEGNFIGFVDDSNTTLQFFLDRPGSIHVEIPVPSRRGSLGAQLTPSQAQKIIADLSTPLSAYEAKLNLEFRSW